MATKDLEKSILIHQRKIASSWPSKPGPNKNLLLTFLQNISLERRRDGKSLKQFGQRKLNPRLSIISKNKVSDEKEDDVVVVKHQREIIFVTCYLVVLGICGGNESR